LHQRPSQAIFSNFFSLGRFNFCIEMLSTSLASSLVFFHLSDLSVIGFYQDGSAVVAYRIINPNVVSTLASSLEAARDLVVESSMTASTSMTTTHRHPSN